MGGTTLNLTYQQVCSGQTGHAEVVQLRFDPEVLTYSALLNVFFSLHDPTQRNRQGPDVGTQYRSVIFYHTPQQLAEAQQVMASLPRQPHWRGVNLATTLEPAAPFTFAEAYHQRYWEKHPGFTCH
jgi:peptide-methionine (S)-S-oxide reductase